MKQTVVIGAGIGGLGAAIELARAGHAVTVVEQLDRPGGKMGELRADGYRWDTGPSVITMRHVFERMFASCGRQLGDYLDLVPLNPITRYFWPDGAQIDAVTDEDAMCEHIRTAGFDRADADGYRRFMRYARRLYDTVSQPFLYRAQPTLRDMVRLPVANALRIDAFRTMHQAVRAHFRDPHLVQLFDRFATYSGSSPFRAPATLNVIAHIELALGAWYPRGGVYQLAMAMERLARELGVAFAYGIACTRVLQSGRAVCGVACADGTAWRADAVICNADYSWALQNLITPSVMRKNDALEPSCSGFVMFMKSRRAHASLAHHNIFFCAPENYRREFDDIFARKIPPGDPTIYLCITSKSDPAHAPAGCENWFVLVNAPYISSQFDWQREQSQVAQKISAQLAARVDGGGATRADMHELHSPLTLQARYNGNCGAIYGFSSNSALAAFRRPANRSRELRGLYFAGGGAHPGGGVPLVALGGLAAARCAIEDW